MVEGDVRHVGVLMVEGAALGQEDFDGYDVGEAEELQVGVVSPDDGLFLLVEVVDELEQGARLAASGDAYDEDVFPRFVHVLEADVEELAAHPRHP